MKNKAAAFFAVLLLALLLIPAAVFADDDTIIIGPAGELIPVESEQTEEYAATAREEVTSSENGHTAIVEDNAALFSEAQRKQLLAQIEPLLQYGNMGILTSSEPNGDAARFAREKYIEMFGETDGTLFLIDMYNRRIQIFSGKSVYQMLPNAKANEITDNVYIYATNSDYFQTAQKAFEQIQIVLEGGRVVAPMRFATNAAFAIGVVLLINFIIIMVQRKRKPAKQLTNALLYTNRNRQTSVVRGVRTVMTKQTKTRHSSGGSGGFSGGGGGFSGGGGGGGFSGGGGGHSF